MNVCNQEAAVENGFEGSRAWADSLRNASYVCVDVVMAVASECHAWPTRKRRLVALLVTAIAFGLFLLTHPMPSQIAAMVAVILYFWVAFPFFWKRQLRFRWEEVSKEPVVQKLPEAPAVAAGTEREPWPAKRSDPRNESQGG